MITQKVDLDDSLLGFTHTWINKLANRVAALYVLALAVGRTSLTENITLFSMGKELGKNRLWRLVRFNQVLTDLALSRKIDLLFVHMCPRYAILAAPYTKLAGIPMVMWFTHKQVSTELRIAYQLVDRVLTASQESFRLNGNKTCIIGHGIDTERFKPAAVKKNGDTSTILSLGRIAPIKDYETLITAAHFLIHQQGRHNLRFVIVGEIALPSHQAYLDHLHDLVSRHQLSGYVTFVGGVPHDKVVDYYQGCDLFVNMSHTGSLDKAVLEAMACGKIPLTCNEAFVELFGDWADRLIFEKGNEGDLADRILWALEMPGEARVRLEKRLRDLVKEGHSIEGLIDRTMEIFQEVVKERQQ